MPDLSKTTTKRSLMSLTLPFLKKRFPTKLVEDVDCDVWKKGPTKLPFGLTFLRISWDESQSACLFAEAQRSHANEPGIQTSGRMTRCKMASKI